MKMKKDMKMGAKNMKSGRHEQAGVKKGLALHAPKKHVSKKK